VEEAYQRGMISSDVDEWTQHGVEEITIQVNSLNALDVHFDALTGRPVFSSYDSSKLLGSASDIKQSLTKRGCDIDAVSNLWILNHKRWIVWNLACYERSFCSFVGGRYLSYERLIRKLEGRYRKEICAGYRPITRMILNRDISATLPMILIVSRFITPTKGGRNFDDLSPIVKLRLTDGWYDIDVQLDSPLSQFAKAGIIRVGTKLFVSNAKLMGAEDGIDPLDIPYQSDCKKYSRPYLCLTANCTRLAKWNCKVGPIRITQLPGEKFSVVKGVSDIIAGGGSIPQMRFIILRCYPIMYLEKGANSSGAPLSEAEEHARLADLERRKQHAVEKIYERVINEVELVRLNGKFLWWTIRTWNLTLALDIIGQASATLLKGEDCNHPVGGKSSRNEGQAITDLMDKRHIELQRRVHEAVEAELQVDDSLVRQSTPFIRLKVHTATTSREVHSETAILTVWHPSEEQLTLLKEGSEVEVQNVSVRPTLFDGYLQLSINGRAAVKCCTKSDDERIRFGARVTLDVFKVHKLSHRTFSSDTSISNGDRVPSPCFDVRGFLLENIIISQRNTPGFELYVTDESLLWLRVHFERLPQVLAKQLNSREEGESIVEPSTTIVIFKDLYLLPFDTTMNCAVAKYSALSSMTRVSASHKFELHEMMKSSGEILRRMSCSIYAKLPWLGSDVRFSRIGYIVGVHSEGGETLLVDVDCGNNRNQWIVTSSMLDAIHQSVEESAPSLSSFLESQEVRLSEMRTLAFLFRIRHVLWRFDVTSNLIHGSTTCAFVVHRIAMVDQKCLAKLYSTKGLQRCGIGKHPRLIEGQLDPT
jgi:hypothetical protein